MKNSKDTVGISERTDWDRMINEVDALRRRLREKPQELRIGYSITPGGILNAYCEGDILFEQAVAELTKLTPGTAMKKVIITRGIPGSGKTTELERNYPAAFVCSAVNFHTDHLGNYNFYPNGIREAHTYCQNAFRAALQNNLPLIAVDNTHIKTWEFANYIEQAEDYGYEVVVIRMKFDDIAAAFERNIHGVPLEVIARMHSMMEDYAGEIFV